MERMYHIRGESSQKVARLIFADFPTSMHVHGIHDVGAGMLLPNVCF